MNKNPQLYLAPLQGLTDFYFRKIYQQCFGDLDRYFAPWIKLDGAGKLKKSYIRDVNPENNEGINLIPQIMCNKTEDFVYLANYLNDLGYSEINWNLGCPHPMATKRGLGSALLAEPDKIISILNDVLPKIQNKLSLKIRLGFEQDDQSSKFLSRLNDFPLTEIIIHARTAKQMYKGKANLDAFENCLEQSTHSICYNGDIKTYPQYLALKERFPQIQKFMIGRGLIANPFLVGMIKNENSELPPTANELFRDFHDQLMKSYASHLSGDKHLLIKMKSFWEYFSLSFKDAHKAHKRIKKAANLRVYKEAVNTNIASGFESI